MFNAGLAVWTARRVGYAVALLWSAVLLLVCPSVSAVTIAPIMVELSPKKKVASVRLVNDSAEAMTFQTETLSWQQFDGVDQYAQTQDLLVAPAIALIAPGASQIFRVTLRKPAQAPAERAYRLVFEDISADHPAQAGMVKILFRHSLPLFVLPRTQAIASAQWSRCAAPAHKACIRLDNQGNRHIRLSSVAVEGLGWHKAVGGGATLLAGASRQWLFDQEGGPTALRILVTLDTGETATAVELS